MAFESGLEGMFHQRLGEWRAHAGRWIDRLRCGTAILWLAIAWMFQWPVPLGLVGVYAAAALALWGAGHLRPHLHRHPECSVLLLDIPAVFALQSAAIATAIASNRVHPFFNAGTSLAFFVILLVVVILLEGSPQVVVAGTTLAITCEVMLMKQAGVELLTRALPTSILCLGLAAWIASVLHRRLRNILLDVTREQMSRQRLGRYFPPEVVRRVLESKDGGALEVSEVEVVALFSDISNFTELSASRQPREVMVLLNEYFPVMAEIVFRHGGTLEKYIGDALLAVWGAPFPTPDDADRAMRAAVELQQAMVALNARWRAQGRAEFQMHVGLNTGRVAAGNLGSEKYLQYATIGDTTNMASRICGVAQSGQIVISESTFERWRDRRWQVERLPPTKVKGKREELTLYRVAWDEAVIGKAPATEQVG